MALENLPIVLTHKICLELDIVSLNNVFQSSKASSKLSESTDLKLRWLLQQYGRPIDVLQHGVTDIEVCL